MSFSHTAWYVNREMPSASTGARAAAKRATRDALIDAAIAEFFAHGPRGASLDAICARAGRTRGALYVHFADREALLVAAMDRLLGGLVRSITAAGEPHATDLAGAIRRFTEAAAARAPAVHADRELRFHHVLEACRDSRAIGDRYRGIVAAAIAWVTQAVVAEPRAGALAGVDASALAQALVAFAFGIVALLELDVAIDPIRIGNALATAFGLCAPASTRATPPRRRQ